MHKSEGRGVERVGVRTGWPELELGKSGKDKWRVAKQWLN
jgi:hypothetical protein